MTIEEREKNARSMEFTPATPFHMPLSDKETGFTIQMDIRLPFNFGACPDGKGCWVEHCDQIRCDRNIGVDSARFVTRLVKEDATTIRRLAAECFTRWTEFIKTNKDILLTNALIAMEKI